MERRTKFRCPPHDPRCPGRQTHIWNSAFGSQPCMNIHYDSSFSVGIGVSFDVSHYSYFVFPGTGILLLDGVVASYCATHPHSMDRTFTLSVCKCWCAFSIRKTVDSPSRKVAVLWKTSRSVWLECSLEAER